MSIAEARERCKVSLEKVPRDALILGVLMLTAVASFGLGYLAGAGAGQAHAVAEIPAGAFSQAFVASMSGTRFYPVGCAGAARIASGNAVYFASAADAEAAGYQPASGCGN